MDDAKGNKQLVVGAEVHGATKAAAALLGVPVKVLVERALVREIRRNRKALAANGQRVAFVSFQDALAKVLDSHGKA